MGRHAVGIINDHEELHIGFVRFQLRIDLNDAAGGAICARRGGRGRDLRKISHTEWVGAVTSQDKSEPDEQDA